MTFDTSDLLHSSPLLLLTVAGLLLLLLDAFSRVRLIGRDYHHKLPAETSEAIAVPVAGSRNYLMPLAVATLLATLALLAYQAGDAGGGGIHMYRDMLVLDRFGLLMSAICVVGAVIGVMTAPAYLREHKMEFGEYYALILFTVAGMMILIQAADLVTVFLGVETMSLGAYVLTGSWRRSARSSEAAMKYFLFGAFVSGLLVYGIALIYGTVGTTSLAAMKHAAPRLAQQPLFYLGWLLILVSFAFKVGAVPFHMWAPDTYEGAPTPVSGFMMACIKTAGFAGLIRLCAGVLSSPENATQPFTGWGHALLVLSILTMTVGNLAALQQDNIKRMLAYSSIAHAGYLLLGVAALAWVGDEARGPLLYYLMAYTLTTVGSMGVVAWLGGNEAGEERVHLEDWAGLGLREPGAALAMTIFLLSLGGFPPTAGFFGKLYLFRVALTKPELLVPVLIAIANSLISVYYYLRVVTTMYFRAAPSRPTTTPIKSGALSLAVLVAVLLVLGLGAMPEWLTTLCAAAGLGG
jgi:NADH-quinone oxidoreductase subunit N